MKCKQKARFKNIDINFGLRGEESDSDENFVVEYCKQNNIPFYVKRFDTEKHAFENKKSIQISARELRYDWFFELKEKHDFGAADITLNLNSLLVGSGDLNLKIKSSP